MSVVLANAPELDESTFRRLGEVCRTTSGGTPSRSKPEYFAGSIAWVKSGELPDGIVSEIGECISDAAIRDSSAKLLPAGTLLIALYGATVGKLGILSRPAATNQAVCAIFPSDTLDTKFLFWYLRSKRSYLIGQAAGGAQPNISQGVIRDLLVPVPPLVIQHEIVAEIEKQFSRLDEAVANLKRVKANLKRYKSAVLKAAVEGRLVTTEAELARRECRSYETGTQLLQRILETRRSQWKGKRKYREPTSPCTTDLTELPEGWSWATMPQIGELNRGKSKHRPRNDERLYGGPYPFIQTGDVRRSDGSITEYSQTYSELGLQQSHLWPAGTLCITIAANIAETGVLRLAACFPDSIVGFLSEEGPTTVQYVEYFIQTAHDDLDRYASATAQKNINLEVLQDVAVPMPPLAEQQRIVAEVDRRLSLVRTVEAEVDANLKRAEKLRQSTLSAAFVTRSAIT